MDMGQKRMIGSRKGADHTQGGRLLLDLQLGLRPRIRATKAQVKASIDAVDS